MENKMVELLKLTNINNKLTREEYIEAINGLYIRKCDKPFQGKDRYFVNESKYNPISDHTKDKVYNYLLKAKEISAYRGTCFTYVYSSIVEEKKQDRTGNKPSYTKTLLRSIAIVLEDISKAISK
jgi:hypothetical protein